MIAILADLTLKATTLLVLAATATALMRHASAASRHLVWTATFGAVLLLPESRDSRSRQSGWPSWLQKPRSRSSPTTPPVTDPRVAPVSTAAEAMPARATPPVSVSVSASPAPRTVAWTADHFLTAIWIAGVSLIGLRAVLAATFVRRLGRCAQF